MKTCLNKDDSGGQPRTPEFAGHLEKLLQQYLQTHFPAAAHVCASSPPSEYVLLGVTQLEIGCTQSLSISTATER